MPFCAPFPIPTIIAVGVASPNAQGHEITKTAVPKTSASIFPIKRWIIVVIIAITITKGTKTELTLSASFDAEVKTKFLKELLAPVTDFLTIKCVQHGKFMHDTAKEDMLKKCFEEYGLKAEETILVDDRIYNQYATINAGAHPIRYRCEYTTDLPEELSWIPEVHSMEELKEWLAKNSTME